MAKVRSNTENTVVVVGHGFAGRHTTDFLVKAASRGGNFTVTVIADCDFYESDVMMPYAFWADDAEYDAKIRVDAWKLMVPGATYIQDVVTSIKKAGGSDGRVTVTTRGGKSIVAAACVLCTGFKIPVFKPDVGVTKAARLAQLQLWRGKIKEAKTVLVAGGGNSGVDIVGRVRQMVRGGAKVKWVINDSMVLSDNCGAADRALLMAKFRTYANLELITNDRVAGVQGRASADAPLSSSEPQTYVLKSGQTIQADVYMQGYSSWAAKGLLDEIPGASSPSGMMLVDHSTLQSKAHPALFAVGCSDVIFEASEGIINMAKLENQAKTVAKNVAAMLSGKPFVAHVSGMAFMKGDPWVHFGSGGPDGHAALLTDSCMPCPGACIRFCCGFPFPCLCCGPCCCPVPCGNTCMRPHGAGPNKAFGDFAKAASVPMLKLAKSPKVNQRDWNSMSR